ncbi:MAG: histidine kinase N-terminal 7TM domain-containing protein [Methanocella sp.]
MDAQYMPYALVPAVTVVTIGVLIWYVWKRRAAPGGLYFLLLAAAGAEWALCNTAEALVTGMGAKIFFAKLTYFGIVSIGPLWLLFTVDYSQFNKWLNNRRIALLWLVPAAILVLVATNEWHGLIWPAITTVSDLPGAPLVYAHGPGVWANMIYTYLLLTAGMVLLIRALIPSYRIYRSRVILLLIGASIPWLVNVLYLADQVPLPGLDLTLLAFTITGMLYAWTLFRHQLFDLVPVARETLISSMTDGVIVLDTRDTVVEINPAAQRLIGTGTAGQHLETLLAGRTEMLRYCQGGREVSAKIPLTGQDGCCWLDLRISPLHDSHGQLTGRLVVLRDISENVAYEDKLKASNEMLQKEVAERKRAEELMAVSLREKEVLLKEIHHRVKNNLQIVSSILSLQSGSAGGDTQAAALRDSQDRIKSMALIHEKLYQSTDISHIDFAEYVRSLTRHLARSYISAPGIRMSVDIERVFLDIDTAIPCGLIINELVSNSLKYAFRDGRAGEVRVSLSQHGRAYTLVVSDDGVGLPPGLDFHNTASLGLQLVNTLVGQLEGTIELNAEKGTNYKITFAEIE